MYIGLQEHITLKQTNKQKEPQPLKEKESAGVDCPPYHNTFTWKKTTPLSKTRFSQEGTCEQQTERWERLG